MSIAFDNLILQNYTFIMRKIDTKHLTPGMIIAEDVYIPEAKVLLVKKGDMITQKDIAKFAFYSVHEVSIESLKVEIPDGNYSDNATRSERVKASAEFQAFKHDFEDCTDRFEHTIKDIINKNKDLELDELMSPIYSLISQEDTTNSVFDMLHNLREYDDATYTHCINVALISNILAKWLRFSPDEVEIATQAGLFHDIGKMMIPDTIIRKKGKLTDDEYNVIKTHPVIGYDVVKDMEISFHVKNAVLMHHERCDGKGYPLKLPGPKIDKYAKLVAIADVYDAMTSARCYRGPLCPFIAIETFEDDGFQKYDSEMILVFLKNIVDTYILNSVRLNTGEIGEIIFINRNKLSKPTIKVGNDYIDLTKCPGVFIEEII